MDIYVLNGIYGVVDIIDSYESAIWNVQYYGQSDFQLVLAGSRANLDALLLNRYLVRAEDMSAGGTYKNVMVITDLKMSFDTDKGWVLTVTGKGLKSIVGRRVVWNQDNITGNAETGIRKIITDNIIAPAISDRAIQNFELDPAEGFTETIDLQCFGENLAEWLESVCTSLGYGWDVYISGGKYKFKLYRGTNRSYSQTDVPPVVFSNEFDNLLSSTYSYTMTNYRNVALIGGEGEGTAQRTASYGEAAGLGRYELYVDGSSVSSNGEIITEEQYTALLKDYGKTMIDAVSATQQLEGEIDTHGLYTIDRDYFLGDVVQVENEMGIMAVPRIVGIIYSDDENGTTVIPTFSEMQVFQTIITENGDDITTEDGVDIITE